MTSGSDTNVTQRYQQPFSPPCYNRPVYDNVGLKVDAHIYENVGALRDATPDLILAVKPKVSLEEEQVTHGGPEDVLLSSPLHLL